MSTDTGNESEVFDDAGAGADAATAGPSGKRPAGKKKPVRRVRVIEVIDAGELDDVDGDIEDVLATLDRVDAATETEEAEAEKPRPVRRKPAAEKPAADEQDEGPEDLAEPASANAGGLRAQAIPGGLLTVGVLVVLLAVVSSTALYFWSRATDLSSAQDDRAAAGRVAGDFGGSIFTYDADHLQAELDHTAKLMTGDLQKRFIANQASVKSTFTKDPSMKLSAKASKVYVGEVNGRFVTALVQLDANLSAATGSALPSSGVFIVTLAKVGGEWKVSDMATTDPSTPSGAGGLPQIGGTPSPTPSASATPSTKS